MLELVTLFVATLIISTTAIWLYRLVSGWQGFSKATVADSGKKTKRRFTARQSFVALTTSTRGSARFVTLPKSSGGIKAPWGW